MTGDEDRLHAQPDFTEWAAVLLEQWRETDKLIEMLRPLIDRFYETAETYPGVSHDWPRLQRKAVVFAEMVETISRLVPHEDAVRALAPAACGGKQPHECRDAVRT